MLNRGFCWLGRLVQGVLAVAVLVVAGFVVYLTTLPHQPAKLPADVAYIAVLTGGSGRVDYGLDLLMAKPELTVLISGVHPQTSLADLTAGHALPQEQLTRLVLDHQAATTRQNVAFIAAWAQRHGVTRVGVVSSYYHMPRVRLLFAVFAPQLDIVPLPVQRPTPGSFFVREYAKLLVAPLLK